MKKLVNIRLEEEILKYVDGFAEKTGVSRAGAISVIIAQYKQSMDGMDTLKNLMAAYQTEQVNKQLPEE